MNDKYSALLNNYLINPLALLIFFDGILQKFFSDEILQHNLQNDNIIMHCF